MNKPDRPISGCLHPIRDLIRLARLLAHKLRLGDKIRYGKNFAIGRDCYLAPPSFIHLGSNIRIGSNFYLESNLEAGNDILISSHVSIIGNDHQIYSPESSVFFSGRLPPSTAVIEGDNLIGHKTIILGNVRVGRGCIIGAGSLVTKDMPSYTVCFGVPAKPVKRRYL